MPTPRVLLAPIAVSLSVLAPLGHAQELLIPESSTDRVMLFDARDGSLIDADFIDVRTSGSNVLIPIKAITVGDEIWVTDQVADAVMRFSADGTTFLGKLDSGLDNVRGIAVGHDRVYVANAGGIGPGTGDAIMVYDMAGNLVANFPAEEPYDVAAVGDEVLVTNIHQHDIERYDLAGNFLGLFHDSDGLTGVNVPAQLTRKRSNGNVLAAGFFTPSGVYEYSLDTGFQVGFIDINTTVRGVFELLNGNLLFTDAVGVHVYDVSTGLTTHVITGVSARLISARGDLPAGSSYCLAATNSTGAGATLSASGSPSVLDNDLTFAAQDLPTDAPAILFYGTSALQAPLGGGVRCVGGPIYRYGLKQADSSGALVQDVDLTNPPAASGQIQAGSTWNFQLWYRDSSASTTANLTDGVQIGFTP